MQPSSGRPGDTVVLIPAYQAEATIESLVKAVVKMGLPALVVDDASSDATAVVAQRAGARVLVRPSNGGKGTALRDGWAAVQGDGTPWVLTMDADGQHLPEEIPRFLQARQRSDADLIVGNRMGNPRGMPVDRRLTNRFMSWLISRLTGQKVPDTQCGFRLISDRVLRRIRPTSRRFEIESELVVKAAWAGFQVLSVPVTSIYQRQISFIRPIRDTFRFFLFLWRLRRERP